MVNLTTGDAQQRCKRTLPVRAVIIHIAYVIEVEYPYAWQTNRDAATDDFPGHELRLQVE